ncbi:MAG: TFIIB-type zinc ribbon-containing protein [Pyrobaculum sp.]
MDRCPACGGGSFVYSYDRGEVVCDQCGTVVQQLVDTGPEWRRAERARVGPPMSPTVTPLLLTSIDRRKDTKGRELGLRVGAMRLRDYQMRFGVSTALERKYLDAVKEAARIASVMGIPKPCVDTALSIIRKAVGHIRGRPLDALAAAALYAACRLTNTPRQIEEFAKYTKASRRHITKSYMSIVETLGVKPPLPHPAVYIPKIASALRLRDGIVKMAIDIAKRAREARLTRGKTPASIAAAAVYIAMMKHGVRTTIEDVAKAANVSPPAVKQRYVEISTKLKI